MALTAEYHLQVGSLVVEDGTGDGDYRVTYMSFPEPAPDGFGGHHPAVRRFDVTVTGDDTSDLSANVAALRRQCVRDKTLYFRPSTSGDMLSCRIREASVTEREVDMLDRVSFEAELTVTLTTDPYWLAPWGNEVDASGNITYVPGHIDIPDPGGEVDALLSMRVVPAVSGTGLFVGVEPDPSDDYEYLDDYGASGAGSADANAYGGYKLVSSGTVDASLSEHWAAPTISHTANDGWHIALARMDTTAANVSVAARVTTAGANISASTTVDEQAVRPASVVLSGIELGRVRIPAGRVMALGDSSYEAAYSEGATTYTGTRTFTSEFPSLGFEDIVELRQTFPFPDGRIETVTYNIGAAAPVGTSLSLTLYRVTEPEGTLEELARVNGCPVSFGGHTVQISETGVTTVTGTYMVRLRFGNPVSFTVGLYYNNGVYMDGELTQTYGTGLVAGDDLEFSVDGVSIDANSTTMPLLASCTEASQTVSLDYIQRIPADFACIAYRRSASGGLGLYYDAGTDTPYVADADGVGPSVFEDCTINKPLRLKPGVTNRVVFGVLQGDVAVAGMTALSYRIRKRYLTATG
jgi:hypothetical protein